MKECSVFIESVFIHVIMTELDRRKIDYRVNFLFDVPNLMAVKCIRFGKIIIYNSPFKKDIYTPIDFDTANGAAIHLKCDILFYKDSTVYYNADVRKREDDETILDYVMRYA